MPTSNPPTDPDSDILAAFAGTTSNSGRSALLHKQPLLQSLETVQALCDRANHLVTEDLQSATRTAEAALWLAESLGDLYAQGLAHRTLANIFSLLARTSEALSEYNSALHFFGRIPDPHQAAITRSSAIPTVTNALGTDAAFAWADSAREIFQEENDQLRLARLENNVATILFRQEDYLGALEHWQAAYRQLQEIGEVSDQAATLRNLAVCHIGLNQPIEATAYYNAARELCEQHGFHFLLHAVDYNIAYLHYLQGDHDRALELYRAARERSRAIGDRYHEALCSLDETEVYLELNLLREAATVAQLAERQFQDLQRPYEAAKARVNRAMVEFGTGNARGALDGLSSAAALFRKVGNRLWPGQVELLRGLILLSEGRLYEARRSAELALRLFSTSKLRRRESLARLLLARVCLAHSDLQEAESLCRSSLAVFQELREPDSLFQASFLLGSILETKGHRKEALLAFRQAEERLTELRDRGAASRIGISLVGGRLDVYQKLVFLLLEPESEPHDLEDLLLFVEKAKERDSGDLLTLPGESTQSSSGMRSQLVDQVSDLRHELNWLYRRLDRSEFQNEDTKASVLQTLQKQSQEKERDLATILARLRSSQDDHLAHALGIPALEFVQEQLHDSVLVDFFLAEDVVVAVVLSKDHVRALPVAVASTVKDLQRNLWYYLWRQVDGEYRASPGALQSQRTLLRNLYTELLEPLEALTWEKPLIIAPHDFLFLVPFHALYTRAGHLIELCPVSYVPSAAAFFHSKTARSHFKLSGTEIHSAGKPPLTAVFPDEFEEKSDYRLGPEASSAQIQRVLSRDSTALHLVTRADLRADNALFSQLEIGKGLTLLDLHRSRLACSLLTLEGEGFAGKSLASGERVSALWTSLLLSGPRSTLVPAWPSSASAHRELVRLFYQGALGGAQLGSAHRQAMLQVMHNQPYFHAWAGLALVGDPQLTLTSPLPLSQP